MELFPVVPEDFAALSDEDLYSFEEEMALALRKVSASPTEYVSDSLSASDLLKAAKEAGESLKAARAEIDAREPEEVTDEVLSEEFAQLAELSQDDDDDEVEDEVGEVETAAADAETAAVEEDEPEAVTAAAEKPARKRLPRPPRSRQVQETEEERVSLVATAGAPGMDPGEAFPSFESISKAMISKRQHFGMIPDGTSGEKVPIVRADWSHLYPSDRKLTNDEVVNDAIVREALPSQGEMKRMIRERHEKALTASGGLCAPVTPYYQLQMVSQADRPVRAALPAFNADRGGIRYARPATLASITTGVGIRSAADDAAGGTFAQKTCQVVDCPPFQETDVNIIYHCLQFGNLGARTFPERVTQWNQLTLAAHSRLAESTLLTNIDTASTQVTASNLGLGASATLFSQITAAANGMRSRHRMDPDAVLRIMLPWWAVSLIVSDVYRSQFQRWDVDAARVTALLREQNVEPSFYLDSASGKGQVWGTQAGGALLAFPSTVNWFLFPEGSFLYLDGGTLELGLVRDSVLNKTNDFQIFGETFENVAFVGVEALSVVSTLCDSGVVAAAHALACPIDYTHTT